MLRWLPKDADLPGRRIEDRSIICKLKIILWHSVGIHGINITGYFLAIFRHFTPVFPLKYYFGVKKR